MFPETPLKPTRFYDVDQRRDCGAVREPWKSNSITSSSAFAKKAPKEYVTVFDRKRRAMLSA